MKNLFSAVLAIIILSTLLAFPVSGQVSPVNQCILADDITIRGVTVLKDSNVSSGSFTVNQLDNGDDTVNFPNSTNLNLNDGTEGGAGISVPTSDWGTLCLINTINKIVFWIFFVIMFVVILMIVLSVFLTVTSQGDSSKQQTATKIIQAALIGLVIAVLARMVPAVVLSIVT